MLCHFKRNQDQNSQNIRFDFHKFLAVFDSSCNLEWHVVVCVVSVTWNLFHPPEPASVAEKAPPLPPKPKADAPKQGNRPPAPSPPLPPLPPLPPYPGKTSDQNTREKRRNINPWDLLSNISRGLVKGSERLPKKGVSSTLLGSLSGRALLYFKRRLSILRKSFHVLV